MILIEDVQLLIQPFHDITGLGFSGIGKQHHKFIPSNAANDVLLPKDGQKEIGQVFQELVTGVVAKCVIHMFEVVQIGHDYADRELAPAVQALQLSLKEQPVVQACEGIVIAEVREIFLDPSILGQ